MARDLANFRAGDIANCVGGHRMPGSSGKTYGVADPVSNSEYMRVSTSKGADVNRAVNMADAALAGPWPALAPAGRAGVLRTIAGGIASRADDIADKETRNTGIPVTQVRGLIEQAVSCFRSAAAALTPAPGAGSRAGAGDGGPAAAGTPATGTEVGAPAAGSTTAVGASGYVLRAPGGSRG
ncbi:MAG TPA: aldehyde dehydrogenase family protein [Trebonia sp.]